MLSRYESKRMHSDSRFGGLLQLLEALLETSRWRLRKRREIRKHRSCQVPHFLRRGLELLSIRHEFLPEATTDRNVR